MTAEQVFTTAEPKLAEWLRTNPRIFVGNVITITHDNTAVRLFAGDIDGSIASIRRFQPALADELETKVRARVADGVAPIIIVTADEGVYVTAFEWAALLAHVPERSAS